MAKEYAKQFYNSPAWRKCRKSFIANRINIDGGMCQTCKEQPGYIVDHKEEITPDNINDTSITLSWSNLQYLCHACHNTKTFGNDNKYFFDEDGIIQEHILPPLDEYIFIQNNR